MVLYYKHNVIVRQLCLLYGHVGRHSYIESTFVKVVYKRKLCKHYSRYSINIELNKTNILRNSNHNCSIRMQNSVEIVHDMRTSTGARSDQEEAGKISEIKLSLQEKHFLCASDGQLLYVTGEHTSVKGIHQNFSEECLALPSLCQENKLTAPCRILRQNQLRASFRFSMWSLWLDMPKINLRANSGAI